MMHSMSTGISGLDSMLKGGLSDGRVVLVLGEPGTGKTILCSQFLDAGSRGGEFGIFVGMNEPKARFMSEIQSDRETSRGQRTFSALEIRRSAPNG